MDLKIDQCLYIYNMETGNNKYKLQTKIQTSISLKRFPQAMIGHVKFCVISLNRKIKKATILSCSVQ